jgi:hypothetical protein
MQIEIDERLCERMQGFTTLPVTPESAEYFTEFFLEIGLAVVKDALHRNPGMTFGDLVMIRYRIDQH